MEYLKKIGKKVLQYESKLILKKYKPKIIAISGSVGKTTTKELLYSVLSNKFYVRKSDKSFTVELGLPLTIIGYPRDNNYIWSLIIHMLHGLRIILWKSEYPDWLILEIDADKIGDLESVSQLLHPDILVLTAIGKVPAHIELFPSVEVFLEENKKIVNSVVRDGVIIYNADDENSFNLVQDSDIKKISCGVGSGCSVGASEYKILYGSGKIEKIPTGMTFELTADSKKYSINIFQSIGIHNVYASMLSFAVGRELKIPEENIISSLNQYKSIPGRMNIIQGIKNTIIIDDSYNSSPNALDQALSVLAELKSSGRKILVVGDMLELGKYSAEEHRKSAHKIKEIADYVFCVGIRARLIAQELLSLDFPEAKIIQTDLSEEAGAELQKIIEDGDTILIKGSQAMRLERVVEEIMRHPEDKSKLLVRQEEEWLSRK